MRRRPGTNRTAFHGLVYASLIVGGTGCMAGGGDGPIEDGAGVASGEHFKAEEEGADLAHELLAEVDLGDSIVAFHRFDTPEGATRVSVSEATPNDVVHTPLSELSGMELTHLEMFKALAPGEKPPELLESLHEFEAEDLGRSDGEVRKVQVELAATHSKSISGCRAFVYEDPPDNCGVRTWTNGRQATYISGFKGLHVGQYWAYATTLPVTLGICNESNSTIYGRIGIDMGGDGDSSYSYWGWATLSPGWMWRWWDFERTSVCRSCTGNVCVTSWGCENPSRYRVDGYSAAGQQYHLYTAEAYQPDCGTL